MGINNIVQWTVKEQSTDDDDVYFNLSSGTWAMSWSWFFLSQTLQTAILLQASPEEGVKPVKVPFEISGKKLFMEWSPSKATLGKASNLFDPAMEKPFCNAKTQKLIHRALRMAHTNHPILILGEKGCQKKNLALGIHNESSRSLKENGFNHIDCFYFQERSIEEAIKSSRGTLF